MRFLACLVVLVWSAGAHAAPFAWTLNANMTRFRVDAATNNEVPLASNPFQSDSLARSASGTLYSADPAGMIWDVTGGFQVPVGPTGRTGIGDLVMGINGLWGFSNASQELFFFDLGSSAVTSAQGITGLGGATITGVAYEASTGDVYLGGNTGLNTDTLFRVPNAATAATTVGPMPNGDAFSYFSDIEFDTTGTLYAMSWYHRWFYTVSTTNAATTLLSTGPHRDVTAMGLTVAVPEPATLAVGVLCSMLLARRLTAREATPGDRPRDPRCPG